MDFIQEARIWIEKARKADPEFKVFGSRTHKYKFAPPVSIAEIHAFEQTHGIILPQKYVRVLNELGNGGAGPYYGLYPLAEIGNDYSTHIGRDNTFLDDTLTSDIWKETMMFLDKIDDDKVYDEEIEKIMANAVVIGTQGCTYDTLLMCSGSERGKIINIDWNLDKDYPPYFTHMTFEEWFIGFFKEVAAHNILQGYSYKRLGAEDQLTEEYENAAKMDSEARIKKRREILESMERFQLLSERTIKCLCTEPDEPLIYLIISLILHSNEEIGVEMFENRFSSIRPESVIPMCRDIPDHIKDRYYKRALEILYTPEISNRMIVSLVGCGEEPCSISLLFFLNDCPCKSSKDIFPYAFSEQNPDKCRGIAAYVICNCSDVSKYQKEVAMLMHSDVWDVAFYSMQGAYKAGLNEPVIIEAYRWMKKHYRSDELIQSNLKRILG